MIQARILAPAFLAALAAGCVRQPVSVAHTPAPPPTVWERQVRNAHDAGDGDYQLRQLRDRAASEPDNVPVRMELARLYRDRGFPDVALDLCRLAAARFPDSGAAHLGIAKALRDLNRRDEARRTLDAFLAAHPQSSPEYYAWVGILSDEAGQWAAGEPAHRKALSLAPAADYLHNNLGYNLLMQQRNEEAAAEFHAALELNPSSQLARNNLGLALAGQNRGSQAIANWQSASDPATAHNNLAAVWIEKGNYSEARKELAVALRYNRAHPAALKNLELVSRLDGAPAGLTADLPQTRWDRWKAGFWRLFVGPLEDTRESATKAAPGQLPEKNHESNASPVLAR